MWMARWAPAKLDGTGRSRMFDIAEQVQRWRASGAEVTVGRVVSTRGFSTRDPAETIAVSPGRPAIGQVASGAARDRVEATVNRPAAPARIAEVVVGDDAAVRAGLACGGVMRMLVQPADDIPAIAWSALAARSPICLVTPIDGAQVGTTVAYLPSTLGAASDDVRRYFARGVTGTTSMPTEAGELFVAALWPDVTLVVVGSGGLADTLVAVAGVLGWSAAVASDLTDAVHRCGSLRRNDVAIVLSHDLDLSGAALQAALASDAGYVGALGARRTQAARSEWLSAHGVGADAVARINGPAGLDIGADTPAEVAVSIVAEVIAVRVGASGGRLRDRGGPVHRPVG
jgi:xanthine dehydrogenase accessory factor